MAARSIKKRWAAAAAVVACISALGVTMVPVPAVFAGSVTCERHGSHDPTVDQAHYLANYLINYGGPCCQNRSGGNFCTLMKSYEGAQLRICGPYNQCTGCSDAGGLAWEIIDQCTYLDDSTGTNRVAGNDYNDPIDIVLRNRNN